MQEIISQSSLSCFKSLNDLKYHLNNMINDKKNNYNYKFPKIFKDKREWLNYLLHYDFIINWSYSLSNNDLYELYYPFFIVNSSSNEYLEQSIDILQLLLSSLPITNNNPINTIKYQQIQLIQQRICDIIEQWINNKHKQIVYFFEDIFINNSSNYNIYTCIEYNRDKISYLLSLPIKIANILKHKTPKVFSISNFTHNILLQSLEFIERNKNHSNIKLEYIIGGIFHILGRILYTNPSQNSIIAQFISYIWKSYPESYNSCKYFEKKVLYQVLLNTLLSLPSKIRGVQHISMDINENDKEISNAILFYNIIKRTDYNTKTSIIYDILFRKFIISNIFDKEYLLTFIYSIYLLDINTNTDFINLNRIIENTLFIWCNNNTIKKITIEQHEYISRIFIYIFQLFYDNKDNFTSIFPTITKQMLSGIQIHIGSPNKEIRRWGMFVAERFSIFFGNGKTLSFEYEPIIDNEDIDIIKEPLENTLQVLQNEIKQNNIESNIPTQIGFEEPNPDEMIHFSDSDSYLDDEESDDLEPFDLNDDLDDLQDIAPPIYLSDCIRLLSDTENIDGIEVSLKVIENIISSKPDDLEERALDLTRSLLFLSSTLSSEESLELRLKSLISLVVYSTKQVVPYLTTQFYGDNHNIQSRLDILKVLTDGAQELSGFNFKLNITNNESDNNNSFKILSDSVTDGFKKKIVGNMVKVRYHPSQELSENIKAHTRIWSSKDKRKSPISKSNEFDKYCGLFFFPLIKDYDNSSNRFNLLGEDCLVLAQLLYSLGIFIESSSCKNHIGERMISSTLELCYVVRLHPESYVRRSIYFSTSRAFEKSSKIQIYGDLHGLILKWKSFLEDVVEMDPDEQARELALICLIILKQQVDS